MISFDLECANRHRFEGFFRDYQAHEEHIRKNMVSCPICSNNEVRRIYTGCSIQTGSSSSLSDRGAENIFSVIRKFNTFIKENFQNVGRDFPDKARAIHYGIDEEKNIYGNATLAEIDEMGEEGISIAPLLDIEHCEN